MDQQENQYILEYLIQLLSSNIPEFANTIQRQQKWNTIFFELFSNGITSIDIFLQYSIKDLFEKGFTLRESFILLREIKKLQKPNSIIHITNQEIESLQYSETYGQLIHQFESYNNDFQNESKSFVIVIGPKNVGKTTFVLNIINYLYGVNRNSLFRVIKNNNMTNNQYYQEYAIKINQSQIIIFTDFFGIGQFQDDLIGDVSNKIHSNLFTNILNYLQNKLILAILFVNYSSNTRLDNEQIYLQQRFFELFHTSFYTKIFFILTYCTDNQPLLYIYKSRDSPIPKYFKNILNKENINNQEKFWIGINNNYLYQYPQNLTQELIEILKKQQLDIPISNFIQNIKEDDNEEIQQLYYQNMLNNIEFIVQKLLNFINTPINNQIQQQYWSDLLQIEQQILTEGFFLMNFSHQFQIEPFEAFSINYLQSELINVEESQEQDNEDSILFCSVCQQVCHKNCELNNLIELANGQKNCQNICLNWKKLSQLKLSTRKIQVEQLDQIYYCKICQTRSQQPENCLLQKHYFLKNINIINTHQVYTQKNCSQIQQKIKSYLNHKKLSRLKQGYQFQQELIKNNRINVLKNKIKQFEIQYNIKLNYKSRYQKILDIESQNQFYDNQYLKSFKKIYYLLSESEIKKQQKEKNNSQYKVKLSNFTLLQQAKGDIN